ncbi:MAG: 2-dehydropantoate 2-reductase [Methylococcales bacterium]
MSKVLKIVIIGAGGIGCYYGARLMQQGHQVTFIARGEHLKAMQIKGLHLIHTDFSFHEKVTAYTIEELITKHQPNDFDLYLLCVKATATVNVAKNLKIWLETYQQKITIASLQNGVDNENILGSYLQDSIIIGGLAVRIGGHIVSPGHVEAKGIAQLILGHWPESILNNNTQLLAWSLLFKEANIPTEIVNNIRFEIWRKLIINNGVNPLSALTSLDTKTLSHHALFGPIVYQLMREVADVAITEGETLTLYDVDEMFQLIKNFDPIKTSMLVDFEKGKPIELEEISGAVITRSKQLSLSVPYTEMVYALLKHKLES